MRCGVLFEFIENCRPTQLFAWAGVRRVDRFPPGRGVALVDQLRDRNLGEVGIAQKFGAIEEGAAKASVVR